MKLAIISDIHDNLVNLEKFLHWSKENAVDEIICCGDVANSDTLRYLSENFTKTIYLVRGNMEIYDEKEVNRFQNIDYLGRYGRTEIAGQRVGLCHEPFYFNEVLALGDCDMIFYGHTHKPWSSLVKNKSGGEATAVNPGTLGGVFQEATFSVWEPDKGKIELKILNSI